MGYDAGKRPPKYMEEIGSLKRTIALANSIIFIADPTQQCIVPANTGAALVTATPSCVCVGTLAEVDGDTTIKLATMFDSPAGQLVFDGLLDTPGQKIAVSDSGAENILSMQVKSRTTQIKIWVNDPNEPDIILIQAQ